ncbi:hypothetical protein Leryth_023044 [Lithospermum erythrorhizon]|nr:hypothetical protein Leryth_023044 [Lithospermum erythrorhizon]
MAAGLQRTPVVILRMDGDDLFEFIKNPSFESEMLQIFTEINRSDGSLHEFTVKAFAKLSVKHGMPPTSDPWVMSNVVEPAIQSCGGVPSQPVSQETFLAEFKRVAESVVHHLREQPVIVAHSENTFDGSTIKRLLSNKFDLDKILESAVKEFPKDRQGKISKEYLRVALDIIAPSTGLPLVGTVEKMDEITIGVLKAFDADEEKMVKEDEFKKLLTEILRSIMIQLEGDPISVSTNSVVHESLSASEDD